MKNKSMSNSKHKDVESALEGIGRLALSDKKCSKEELATKELQCPFTWTECTKRFDEIDWINLLKNKLSRKDSNDWRLYCFKILLGCIYVHRNEEKKAIQMFDSCENFIKDKSSDTFFKDIIEGLQHIISACRFHLNIQMGKSDTSKDNVSIIESFKELNKECQAAVWATKAYILCEFGYEGLVEALKFSKLAVMLDPDDNGNRQGAWYYLTGKIHLELRRLRSFSEGPCKEELDMLERSTKKNPFPIHVVVLSDSYREAAKVLLTISYKNKPKTIDMCKTSKRIYEEAMTQKNLTLGILRRCGMGLMKLPKVFRNLKLVEEAFEAALRIAPENPTALLGMGYFKDWHKSDYNTALICYKKSYSSGNIGAGIQTMKLQYKLNNAYNPLDDCNRYISNLKNSLKSRITLEWIVAFLSIKGEYYLFVKGDLLAAAQEWEKAIDTFPDAANLREYRYILVAERKEVNIYRVLSKEIREVLRLKKFSRDNEEHLVRVLQKCQENE